MTATEYKNIVIVGALSGFLAASFLKDKLPPDYRTILIDTQEEVFYPIAALRAAVIPGWEKRIHVSFKNVFGKNSRHIPLPSTTVLELKERAVVVDKPHPEHGLGLEIPFEYCIIATGASQAPPARPAGPTGADIETYLRSSQETIASSSHVLVVGGGPAGIEFATDVKETHPHIHVTLVHRSERLMRYAPKAHEKVLPVLEGMGIEVILEDEVIWPEGYEPGTLGGEKMVFRTKKGREIEAQYVYRATGNIPNTHLISALDPLAINPTTKCIRVHPTFQIDSSDRRLQRVFAVGDVADVPEIKLLGGSLRHGRTAAANILSLVRGGKAGRRHTPRPSASSVTLGTHNALLYTPWFTVTGRWIAALMPKDMHSDRFREMWSGGERANRGKALVGAALVLGGVLWLLKRVWRSG